MPNNQPQSRKLPSKDQVLDLMLKRCATTCNPKGGCGGVCKRAIETFTIDAIIQATAELCQRSETGEHICPKCGLRVEPHRCGGEDAAF